MENLPPGPERMESVRLLTFQKVKAKTHTLKKGQR